MPDTTNSAPESPRQPPSEDKSVTLDGAVKAGGTLFRFAQKHGINTTQLVQLAVLMALVFGVKLPPVFSGQPATAATTTATHDEVLALAAKVEELDKASKDRDARQMEILRAIADHDGITIVGGSGQP